MAWTTPRTWTSYELVTAALMNTHVRDNLKHFQDTRYIPIPLSTAYYDSGTMGGFLTSATIGVAKDDGIGSSGLTTFPYQGITFPNSGTTGVAFNFHVPPDYGGSPVLYYNAWNDGNNVLMGSTAVFIAYIGALEFSPLGGAKEIMLGTNTDSLYAYSLTGIGEVFGTQSISITNTGGLAAGRTGGLYFVRTPGAEGDTITSDIVLMDLWLGYSPAA